jgi:hypothetical protein
MVTNRFQNVFQFLRRALRSKSAYYRDESFSLGFPRFHYEMEYCEGNHRLRLTVGRDGGSQWWDVWKIIYFPEHPKWEAPFASDFIDDSKANSIRRNVEKAASSLDWAYEIRIDST